MPEHTGRYTPEIGAVYALCVSRFAKHINRTSVTQVKDRPVIKTRLYELAEAADLNSLKTEDVKRAGGRATPQYALCPKNGFIDLVSDEHLSAPLERSGPMTMSSGAASPRGSLKPVDMFHRSGVPDSAEAKESTKIQYNSKGK